MLALIVEFMLPSQKLSDGLDECIAVTGMPRVMKFRIRKLTVIESMLLLGVTALAVHFLFLVLTDVLGRSI
jgi:hypothetical protein